MAIFGEKKERKMAVNFASRKEAFSYMLVNELEQGTEAMEAVEKADNFAAIFAKNMGLPEVVEPQKTGIDYYISSVDKVVCYCEEHPKVVDLVAGAATFALGLFAGRKEEAKAERTKEPEPINFDEVD